MTEGMVIATYDRRLYFSKRGILTEISCAEKRNAGGQRLYPSD